MKRDMDLVRLLLLQVEREEGEEDIPGLSDYAEDQTVYHAALLIEAGLVEGQTVDGPQGVPVGAVMTKLTWAGHDFLDKARNDTIWNKSKDFLKSKGVPASIEVLKTVLMAETKRHLGLP